MNYDKTVLFVSGMPCSGKSYAQGLLRNNPRILSIPWGIHFFVYYQKYDFQNLPKTKIVDFWYDFFFDIQNVAIPPGQQAGNNPIANELDLAKFRTVFSEHIAQMTITVKNLFFILHFAYAEAASIDYTHLKYIAYEFLLVPFEESIGCFDDFRIIQLTKDMSSLFISVINRRLIKKTTLNLTSFIDGMIQAHALSADIDNKAGNRLIYVRYEDLLKQKTATLKKICAWLEVDYCEEMEESRMSGYPFTQKKIVPADKKTLLASLANTVFHEDQKKFGYLATNFRMNIFKKMNFLRPMPNEFFIKNYVSAKYSIQILNILSYLFINLKIFAFSVKQYLPVRYLYYKGYLKRNKTIPARNPSKML